MASNGSWSAADGPAPPRSAMVPNHKDLEYIQQYFEAEHQLDPKSPGVDEAAATNETVEGETTESKAAEEAEVKEDGQDTSDDDSTSSDSDSSDDSDSDDGPLMSIEETKKALLAKVDRDDRAQEQAGLRQEINQALEDDDDDEDDAPLPKDIDSEAGFNKYYSKMKPEKFPQFPDSMALEPTEEIELFAKFKNYSDDCVVLETAKEFVGPNGEQIFLESDSVVCLEDRTLLGRIDDVFGPVVNPLYSVRYDFAHYKQIKTLALAPGTSVYRVKQHSVWKYVNQEMESQRKAEEKARLRELENPDAEELSDDDTEMVNGNQGAARGGRSNGPARGQREDRSHNRQNRGRGGGRGGGGRGGRGGPGGRGRGGQHPYSQRPNAGGHGYVDPDDPRGAQGYSDGYNKLSRNDAPPAMPPAYHQPPQQMPHSQYPPQQSFNPYGGQNFAPNMFGMPPMPPMPFQHPMQMMFGAHYQGGQPNFANSAGQPNQAFQFAQGSPTGQYGFNFAAGQGRGAPGSGGYAGYNGGQQYPPAGQQPPSQGNGQGQGQGHGQHGR